jgi:hypothetical protein
LVIFFKEQKKLQREAQTPKQLLNILYKHRNKVYKALLLILTLLPSTETEESSILQGKNTRKQKTIHSRIFTQKPISTPQAYNQDNTRFSTLLDIIGRQVQPDYTRYNQAT